MCTDGVSGWVLLNNYTGACPSDPEMCDNGFALTMWLKLYALPENVDFGYVMSLGAEKEGKMHHLFKFSKNC